MTDKLKPCPFCGGDAEYSTITDEKWGNVNHFVTCSNHCIEGLYTRGDTKEEAIEQWNTRPNPWHTGTPTEKGWYLIKYECLVEGRYKGKLTYRAVHIYYDKYGIYNEDGSIGNDEVWKPIEYQIIEQNKETE